VRYLHIYPREKQISKGQVILSSLLVFPDGSRQELWYSLDEPWAHAVTSHADCFAVGTVCLAMRHGFPLFIHGPVSPSLLTNLEEFQAIWHCWKPEECTQVDLRAETEREAPHGPLDSAVACYSGGVDASFTIWRHLKGQVGRRSRRIAAALFLHGCDIPLTEEDAFDRAAFGAEDVLAAYNVPLLRLKTNWRSVPSLSQLRWNDVFGTTFASAMHVVNGLAQSGLLASGDKYYFVRPHGSSPLTDRLLSSHSMQITNDAGEFSRIQKVAQLAQWTQVLPHLRVCWEGKEHDRNCGRCEKCIRTILNFRVVGAALPPCFDMDVTDAMIASVAIRNSAQRNELLGIVDEAERSGRFKERWVQTLRKRLARYDHDTASPGFLGRLRQKIAMASRVRKLTSIARTKKV
jgi:hypothetical protein